MYRYLRRADSSFRGVLWYVTVCDAGTSRMSLDVASKLERERERKKD
jgi:hypothetical protein